LFLVDQPISLTERFKFVPQRIEGNLDKVLIIPTTNIDTIFHSNIKAYNQTFNFSIDAMVNNQSSRLVQTGRITRPVGLKPAPVNRLVTIESDRSISLISYVAKFELESE
jgi:hypothetical protein